MLIKHLRVVAEHVSVNKMTSYNLGVAIGASLMYIETTNLGEGSIPGFVTEILIDNYEEIFDDKLAR
jgi:hypothetical protein